MAKSKIDLRPTANGMNLKILNRRFSRLLLKLVIVIGMKGRYDVQYIRVMKRLEITRGL
jgi:hypothetical protein